MTTRTKFIIAISFIGSGLAVNGGDILRGGSAQSKKSSRGASNAPTPDATDAARANAKDTLARTTRAITAMRNVQDAARNAAIRNSKNHLGINPNNPLVNLPKVTDGLSAGGLIPHSDPRKWLGADSPTQTKKGDKTRVTIKQNDQQAFLTWDQFNIGKKTTLAFDQSKGGADVSKWIAFNQITDPTQNPTQILGSIKAAGQVYIINPNGIIFGGSSRVDARGLTASSLPVNTNLVSRGLLNNPDAQFLFSGLQVPGGKDGTPVFNPSPPPIDGKYGDVTVQAGAILKSPAGKGGNGGRIMLVGPNVTNAGSISTESGQTILAAGLQVGVAEHASNDPSLRGLDVWVGAVGDGAGKATNSGSIEALTGSVQLAGKTVNQLGVIDSTTSVGLNGRIDLKASYGAVANPNFDSLTEGGAGAPRFLNQFTGTVKLGVESVTRILPDYISKKSIPGTTLPQKSQINVEGLTIHFAKNSTLLAPNADVSVRAGVWPYKDLDGDRTIFDAGVVGKDIVSYFTPKGQRFVLKGGQIYLDDAAVISVAGSVDAYVPLAQSILEVKIGGSELADSPLVKKAGLKDKILTVDIRNTGTYNGKYWVGTPLGDVTGLVGLIQKNAEQLTAEGGNINLQSGGSIIARKTSILDVSGGYFKHQGGSVRTSSMILGGRLVAVENATPDQNYDGVFSPSSTSGLGGIIKTFGKPLLDGNPKDSYVEGASGGTLSLTAPSMALDGKMRGLTVKGPRQRNTPPGLSQLKITFEAEKELTGATITPQYIKSSPTPPAVVFAKNQADVSTPVFSLADDLPADLPAERIKTVTLASSLVGEFGFGALEVNNPDGSIRVPEDVTLTTTPKGGISLNAANVTILGQVKAPGGKITFNAYNLSPSFVGEYNTFVSSGSELLPLSNLDRGQFYLGAKGSVSTAGLLVDDSRQKPDFTRPNIIDGGSVIINSSQATLVKGSSIDVSGGASISEKSKVTYGKGGAIAIATGKDLSLSGVLGGGLVLDAMLSGYSGSTGGSLSVQAGRIQVGGNPKAGGLNLGEEFFRTGGFSKFNLVGIGSRLESDNSYMPGVLISEDVKLNPRATSLFAVQNKVVGRGYSLQQIEAVQGVRSPVSLSFTALGSDDPFTGDILELRGDIVMGKGSVISTDAGASVSFKGDTVTLLGSVIAPGGMISLVGANAFPVAVNQRSSQTTGLATVHLGSAVRLTTVGTTQLVPDNFGRRVGKVFDGGVISLSGNIVAESGSVLDVSGTSGVLDLTPAAVVGKSGTVKKTAGLSSKPSQIQSVATKIDSNGGTIDFRGSQMLLVDSTLHGAAGGSMATGGTLSVSSGKFYIPNTLKTGADVNLEVKQSGNVILLPNAPMGVGKGVLDTAGVSYGDKGYFAVDRFEGGKFASLVFGGKPSGSDLFKGGNLDFKGKIKLSVSGSLRLAAGGVIRADDSVAIAASYISLGRDFTAPLHPDDVYQVFEKEEAGASGIYSLSPTFGLGALALSADLIDVGNISLQNIGKASLTAANGDIRGNGTLSMAGDLTLKAAQIYPTTLGKFDLFAYDHGGLAGSVKIENGGKSVASLSAGGSLGVYASKITQDGVLRAPFGTIRLGWDGTDLDPSSIKLDSPVNAIAGLTLGTPVTQEVILTEGSLTSVTGKDMEIPFGLSADGLSWTDPRGVNITLSDLPKKEVYLSGDSVKMENGATVDIRGGGDLLASRWVAGSGGNIDLLGTASGEWGGGEYLPGALVTYRGATWSARVKNKGQTPGINPYWSKVEQSYAIIPTFAGKFSPYAAYNTGPNATALSGNPGYVDGSLKVGDTVTLEASAGLPAGTYTLLPRAYANYRGAFLITPVANGSVGSLQTETGAAFVSGYLGNNFDPTATVTTLRSRFEIASNDIIKERSKYTIYAASDFVKKGQSNQPMPADAGYARFSGNKALALSGNLLTEASKRGAMVDITSFADISLKYAKSQNPTASQVTLDSGVIGGWGVESLLVGGVRRTETTGTTVDVRTSRLILDNPGQVLSGPEIILAADVNLTVTAGSRLASTGNLRGAAVPILIESDGTLIRVSSDAAATVRRSGLSGLANPLLQVGENAAISGPSVILDSTASTQLSPTAVLDGKALTLSSGLINVVFDGVSGPVAGSNNLTLTGVGLSKAQQAEVLTLQSYGSIDFYGSGQLGNATSKQITLASSGLRGFQSGEGTVAVIANDIFLSNERGTLAAPDVPALSGGLKFAAKTLHLGANQTRFSGFSDVSLNATKQIIFNSEGKISTPGNLFANTPIITGGRAANYTIVADKNVSFLGSGGVSELKEIGATLLVQGAAIKANGGIFLPSGHLTLRATEGPLEVGGKLSVAGTSKTFNDLVRFSNAGTLRLEAANGDVSLSPGGELSVAADMMGGNAGNLEILAPKGVLLNSGSIRGEKSVGSLGSVGGLSGSFLLDTKSLAAVGPNSFSGYNSALDAGGFYQSRDFRIREGDVNISNVNRSSYFGVSADQGSILVTGGIDASGDIGGSISLSAQGSLTLANGARLSAAGTNFSQAGKGGSILLEAGTQVGGVANPNAILDLQEGSQIDLGVAAYVAGSNTLIGSSAFEGKFSGALHLRAPRTVTNDEVQVAGLKSNIFGSSAILLEGFKVYTPTNGVLNIAQRNLINSEGISFLGEAGTGNSNEVAMRQRLLTGASENVDSQLVIAPGVEMVNLTGNLTLGLANPTGGTNVEGLAAADWDLSGFRYGSRSAPGVLTLRAGGDIIFNNTLSDGFTPIAQGAAANFANNGHSLMWLGRLMTAKDTLPVNLQSWSYRITAGADLGASNFRNVISTAELDRVQPLKGSVLVGEFYPAVPNSLSTGPAAATGVLGQTADTIRIATTDANRGTRFEVVRTGTGDITINAGRDVQLRNTFSTIYTAGVAVGNPTTLFQTNDFVAPVLPLLINNHPSQTPSGVTLGSIQQLHPAAWSMAGGDISIEAGLNMGRYTLVDGVVRVDSSRQMPTNWLYRRGYVDSKTGMFANDGGITNESTSFLRNVTDVATSTTWWVDYSNFFQGVGTLGGGDVRLNARNDIVNFDAVAPTNARMAGRRKNPDFGLVAGASEYVNLAPDAKNLLELGGGAIEVRSGRDINGGIYYAERGQGALFAGRSITTNAARSSSSGILNGSPAGEPLGWLPTTLFVGKSRFDVAARGDVLLGPVTNPFLLPQGVNNKFWYKTYFNTFSADAGVDLASYGGNITHRTQTSETIGGANSLLANWYSRQNLFIGAASSGNSSYYQPWLRLAENGLNELTSASQLMAPNLKSTSFSGDINLAGSMTLFPSATGNLELVAGAAIVGLQKTGSEKVAGRDYQIWTSSTINVSDAAPSSIPSISSPLAYQSAVGRALNDAIGSQINILAPISLALNEVGSASAMAASSALKQALHGSGLLHAGDTKSVNLYALGGDITGMTLFSPKYTRIMAERDITDVSFYLQNLSSRDISLVSAGRDIRPFDENSAIRAVAGNLALGNAVGGPAITTAAKTTTKALAGDIQINGPGVLEVLSGRSLDLGTGANFADGTGVGLTSIGNVRNPNLVFDGADIIALAGVSAADGVGPAGGLSASSLNFKDFIVKYLLPKPEVESAYLQKLGLKQLFTQLTPEQGAIVALEKFYQILRDTSKAKKKGQYKPGDEALAVLFGTKRPVGDILTQARDIRTTTGGAISLGSAGGGIAMASVLFGNPLTPPGVVTEYGGAISTFTHKDVSIGQARIFTLRGGDIMMWSSTGNIAAGNAPKTVVTAPPTRVVIDVPSADVQTDLGGLATGGGIGVLAAVEDVKKSDIYLVTPRGFVDAGDGGIRATGNVTLSAPKVLNASNVSAGGKTTGAAPVVASGPSVSAVASASNASAAAGAATAAPSKVLPQETVALDDSLSIITVDIMGYGDAEDEDEEEER